jgi:hypothetical protein
MTVVAIVKMVRIVMMRETRKSRDREASTSWDLPITGVNRSKENGSSKERTVGTTRRIGAIHIDNAFISV